MRWLACLIVAPQRATMSQQSSLTQSAHSVRQVLTAYRACQPGRRHWQGSGEGRPSPTSALKPLLTEALGLTDSKSANVYLSDGGHFDNLGIYEMIRRRCRYILVVDADADEHFTFEDLARSVRFAAIDLDARIEFEPITMKSVHEATPNSPTFAIGKITYAESPADASWLIYIKPTYFYENAPVDVRSYGMVNPTFPHETTLDQWFGECQFESYRRL